MSISKQLRTWKGIIQVEGIDLLMVGPNDLSASIGQLGNVRSAESIKLYDEIARICKAAQKPFGVSMGADDHQTLHDWISRGAVMIGTGSDLDYISRGCRDTIAFLKTLG